MHLIVLSRAPGQSGTGTGFGASWLHGPVAARGRPGFPNISRLALASGDFDSAIAHAEKTVEIGSRFGDRNLLALGLHDKGSALVRKGDAETGLALIEEATVAAVSGELSPYATGIVYCGVIAASRDIADLARAGNWTDAAQRWCDRQAISGFPGVCRVNRAEVMRLRGSWTEAEE